MTVDPGGPITCVTLTGESIDADVLVAAIGCTPNVGLAATAQLMLAADGGIAVDARCRT